MPMKANPERKERTLLYQVIVDDILAEIEEGAFSFDVPICTENKLIEKYSISRITARRAMTELETMGVLYRKRGVGSFVSQTVYENKIRPQPSASKLFAFIFPFNISRTGLTTACQSANNLLMSRDAYASTFIAEEGGAVNDQVLLNQLLGMEVAGLAFYPQSANYHLDLLNQFAYRGKPVVLIDVPSRCPHISSVMCDNVLGITQLMDHLVNLGHLRIAYVSGIGADDRSSICERIGGYVMSHDKAGISLNPELIITDMTDDTRNTPIDDTRMTPLKALLLRLSGQGVTAILAEHDQLAFEMIVACRELNIDVPNDLSICGFDDSEWAHLLQGTHITTVKQDMDACGREVAQILIDGQDSMLKSVRQIVLPTQLTVGTTTGPARQE